MHQALTKLDNPAWWALNGVHRAFAVGTAPAFRYQRGILPFAAVASPTLDAAIALDPLLEPEEIFFLIGDLPPLPAHWSLLKELPCQQMVLNSPVPVAPDETAPITQLSHENSLDMYNLVQKVQPGYYEKGTHRLGNYVGIWQQQQLVAIAGERMRMENLTEISAICTDPAYTGRQYAQRLTAYLCHTNLQQGITPFLHVLESNERAIRIYEFLGFTHRRSITFWQLKKLR